MTWDDGNPYVDQLADGVYAYVQPDGGWMVNNCGVAVDGSGTAILVDTTSTEKRNRAVLAEVAKVSTGAPRAVVNTHHHPDHTYGNGFLPEETLVIGHDKCREMVLAAGLEATKVITAPDYGDLTLRPPEITFPDRMTLHLDEFPVELLHVGGPAHTTNDVLVWLPEQKVLFSGDLAFNGGQPFVLEGSIAGFRRAITQMTGPAARGARARPRTGVPRRRRGDAAGQHGRLPGVRRARRRRVVRRRPHPARGRAEEQGQPVQHAGPRPSGSSATCTGRTPSWPATRSTPGSRSRRCGRTW